MPRLAFSILLAFFCPLFLYAYPFSFPLIQPAYQDNELVSLWDSLYDIYHPTYQDYEKVEYYLKYGRRPYLDPLFNFVKKQNWNIPYSENRSTFLSSRVLQHLKLVGAQGRMPEFHQIALGGSSSSDKSRCILLYASHNAAPDNIPTNETRSYEEKAWDLVKELESMGYKGHVLLRIGGYPLTDYGSMRLAHIPYAFKVLSLIEASLLGYDNVLWLDSSIHPTCDLSAVFQTIEVQGGFFMWNGVNLDYDYNYPVLPDEALISSNVSIKDIPQIPHIIAGICGVSFNKPQAHNLIHEWYRLTNLTEPAMSLYPEEFLLSIACYRTGCKYTGHIGHYMDVRSVTPKKPVRGSKPFWFDKG